MSAKTSEKLAKIFLKSELVRGDVTVAIQEQRVPLKVKDASIILGSDLTEKLVLPDTIVVGFVLI